MEGIVDVVDVRRKGKQDNGYLYVYFVATVMLGFAPDFRARLIFALGIQPCAFLRVQSTSPNIGLLTLNPIIYSQNQIKKAEIYLTSLR